MKRPVRYLLLGIAWTCLALGSVGVFVPVLPTTPFLLLATFLFARCSPRLHRWITNTRLYGAYVRPFKEAGGMPLGAKVRMLCISYAVLAVSALVVQRPVVWAVLGAVALFLLWLVTLRIPTIAPERVARLSPKVAE